MFKLSNPLQGITFDAKNSSWHYNILIGGFEGANGDIVP